MSQDVKPREWWIDERPREGIIGSDSVPAWNEVPKDEEKYYTCYVEASAYRKAIEALEWYGFKMVPDCLNEGRTEISTELGKLARQTLRELGELE